MIKIFGATAERLMNITPKEISICKRETEAVRRIIRKLEDWSCTWEEAEEILIGARKVRAHTVAKDRARVLKLSRRGR